MKQKPKPKRHLRATSESTKTCCGLPLKKKNTTALVNHKRARDAIALANRAGDTCARCLKIADGDSLTELRRARNRWDFG